MTYTYSVLELPETMFEYIKEKMIEGGYHDAFDELERGRLVIDMHGIAVAKETEIEQKDR